MFLYLYIVSLICRGFAHVGVIKALEEAGIPVDMIGGTSMGALVGGVYAEERNSNQTEERTCKWSKVRPGIWQAYLACMWG